MATTAEEDEDVPELTTFQSREAYVYAPLPPAPHYGHRAELWDVNKWLREVKVRVVTRQDDCFVRMEDLETGELFAECPLPSDGTSLTTAIEPVVDSSRYFVARIVDRGDKKKHAFVGLGFRDRADASDFTAALDDFRQLVRRSREAEAMRLRFGSGGGGGGEGGAAAGEGGSGSSSGEGGGGAGGGSAEDYRLRETITLKLSSSLKRSGSGDGDGQRKLLGRLSGSSGASAAMLASPLSALKLQPPPPSPASAATRPREPLPSASLSGGGDGGPARETADSDNSLAAATPAEASGAPAVGLAVAGGVALAAYGLKQVYDNPSRTYDANVGDEYDAWTDEGILEYYWGEHIHLGWYTEEEREKGWWKADFKAAKLRFTQEMFRFSGSTTPKRILDVGCGFGGSSRWLASQFPEAEVIGITLSPKQVERGTQLAKERGLNNVTFKASAALR
ncbi:Uncharacterized protein MNEG_2019 [Monoraphidium neglectum]|uniref:NECAP PHear domain-containing protein n=1 Tax=Monoraphidium neglectum TaxID=145388 RepID=A0A0D2NN05_9CHLO|nr:Uncharacterized protein MNEG_2019 [Monoraphidium neglectum]KIZ05946.1 Uncharacterized protein MNEG_2019 [Monoraphidium neglectum]|eukprot:XP_013904965.1 Uncharacterized protein MNEG_2019 [Monoraphidium neglectum]